MTRNGARRPLWHYRVFGGIWLGCCLIGSLAVMRYDFTPGRLGPAQARWPNDTRLQRHEGTKTVVAFLHPRCVCTRATVTQLVRTLKAHPRAEVIAAVFVPEHPADRAGWEEGDYVKRLRAHVPSLRLVYDAGAAEAKRFGALTSGTVLVYDPEGHEVFRGGITNRRGGEEENPGLRRFARTLSEERQERAASSPVFGCPIIATAQGVMQQ